MTEDFSLQMQISICVALTAGIFSITLGIAFLQFNYLRNETNKYFESVTETPEKDFLNLEMYSKGTPVNGAEIYKVCMNMGLSFESITVNYTSIDKDGNSTMHTDYISVNESSYTEDKMVDFVNRFATDFSTKVFIMDATRQSTTLWELTCNEVGK